MEASEEFFDRKKQELNVTLNEVQKQAVLHGTGPLLLLASPGSGKTTTIIMRIGYLIEVSGVDPARIKAVTFSKASALDMKERFSRFFPRLPTIDFSTIHSLAFEVVREYYRSTRTNFKMIEGSLDVTEESNWNADHQPLHKKFILRRLFSTLAGEPITDDQMEELSTYISYIKNKLIPVEKWALVKCDVPKAEQILLEYEAFKRSGTSQLLVDFDDMLTIGNEAFEKDAKLLSKYQQKYDFVLTDESQDTSLVQHAIIEKLVSKHGNLSVVADDDQSIYSWRGAEPAYLLNFKDVYPQAVTLFMEQNYRSSPDIVNVANQFIKRNKNRYEKNMFTVNAPKEPIQIQSFADYQHQVKYLAEAIREVGELGEVAVLFRNNSSSITLMNEFERVGIPFYIKDADNRFFSHWVVEDILNFMRMTFTDKRSDLLEKIHNKLSGYVTKQQIQQLKEIDNNESVFDNLLNHVQLQDYQRKILQECKETFQQMKGMPPVEAIRVIRTRLGYEKAIEKLCERFGFRKDYLIGILNTLEEIADTLPTMESFAKRLKHLEQVMKNAKSSKHQNVVTLSTFHSSKGLEFKRVYMIDLIEGVMPSEDDKKKNAEGQMPLMEEAVRLFYVGMTRAKIKLELLSYTKKDGEKVEESTFINGVRQIIDPPKLVTAEKITKKEYHLKNINAITAISEIAEGIWVRHATFGLGMVIKLAGKVLEIKFADVGMKSFSSEICIENGLLELAQAKKV
ncbi:ATP-dependent helicase [Paenibacillus psychroresistens]|uniref:DNA 3'-5' helicase n=1 Tax=Paenibacillus psychroresistens TaxID=1778678 RepID=A0A6B8RTX3_9BACL|nr:ATP-dependent helicase [Paenibacillus psychroresistens]QGQ99025.1 ATP-dependent helicase [Paenibacillus psychroresistens]